MNEVFVDTSAIYALLVPSDTAHAKAGRAFAGLAARQAPLVTTSYVLAETYALLTHRLGLEAAAALRNDFEPLFEVVWVERSGHDAGLDLLLSNPSKKLSLVDAVSFVTVRRRKIREVFAYDRHFNQQEGFSII